MPLIFLLTLILIIWIRYESKRTDRHSARTTRDFWERERQASFARKADLSKLPYIRLPEELLDSLPEELPASPKDSSVEELLTLAKSPILNLTGQTNTDLKEQYGVANLEFLTECDENFTRLCLALNETGRLLIEAGQLTKAEQLLAFAVSCGSDVQESYLLLAQLYCKTGSREGLTALKESLSCFDPLRRASIEDALEAYHIPE